MNAIENEQLCSQCAQAFIHGSDRLGSVPGLIKGIIETEAWRERKVRTGEIIKLKSFRDLIVLPPLQGWGEDPAKIEAVIRDEAEVLALWREVMTPAKHIHHDDTDNISISHGTSRNYTLTRLKSQYPKIYEQVKTGRLSANAGAIKAGFRKNPTVLERLIKLWTKASAEERKKFLKSI